MKLIHIEEISSTNDYVKQNIQNLEDMSVVYADRQTNGHGRLGRTWVDTGDDNLFMTIVLKPFKDLNPIYSNFTQYLSVILALVLEEEYNLSAQIKWPNDVLINGKKIAGILSEGTTKGDEFLGLALGLGVNFNTKPETLALIDKPATSIFAETGMKIDKEIFIKKLLNKFCLLYDSFIKNGFLSVKNLYVERAFFLGKDITINVLGELHSGTAENITDEGSLILNEDNNARVYLVGDIL
ncbi:biotin--[bacterium]|nr:biotin--[acetyl-CoA-carboxylase] ligase [bacterium]